jgi:hypothetical protein
VLSLILVAFGVKSCKKNGSDITEVCGTTTEMETKTIVDMSAVRSSKAELEEKMAHTLGKQLKTVIRVVEQQAQKLREELKSEL